MASVGICTMQALWPRLEGTANQQAIGYTEQQHSCLPASNFTHPGGGPCLKGVAPRLTASSAFFRQMAGYSAWP